MKPLMLLSIVTIITLLFAGCISPPVPGPTPTPVVTPTALATSTPAPTPSPTPPIVPFGMVYVVRAPTGSGPGNLQEINVTLWFEEQRDCGGKPAFLGIGKFGSAQMGGEAYYKTTVYRETGEYAQSAEMQRSELAFDTAKIKTQGVLDVAFPLNNLFASAGRNFITDEVWNATQPVILRNVSFFGGATGDIAVTKKGTDASSSVPCTVFTLASRNSPTAMEVCVATVEKSSLPYAVYFKPEDSAYENQTPTWRLVQSLSAASGITRTPQCLTPVYCPVVNGPSGDSRTACESDGRHTMSEVRDSNGCTLRYDCVAAQQASLQVEILDSNGQPVANLEVDAWLGSAQPSGGPQLVARTNAQGKANFNVSQGTVWIGFNGNNFPSQYRNPGQTSMQVEQAQFSYTLTLRNS